MITNEFLVGAFTGTLTTFTLKDGRRVSFKKPYPRVERGAGYNVQVNSETDSVRLIEIVAPLPGGER